MHRVAAAADMTIFEFICPIRTETEIGGARFHRARHVKNVPHDRKATVTSPPVICPISLIRPIHQLSADTTSPV